MSLVLKDFYADWCGPCQMMAPVVEGFIKAHPEIELTKINIDNEEELADKYGVTTIPCLVLERDGEEVAREVGVVPPKKLEKMLG